MRVVVIQAPDYTTVLETDDARDHLEVRHSLDDAKITRMIAAALGHLDGPDGWLGRAIRPQTLEARFDPSEWFGHARLPFPPVIEIESVKFLDSARAEHVVPADDYELFGRSLEVASNSMPASLSPRESIRVTYRAGYETLPGPIRSAALLMVGDLYLNRETSSSGASSAIPMSTTVENLLGPLRVYS